MRTDRDAQIENGAMFADCWKLVTAFDDKIEEMSVSDRRIPYGALIMLVTWFCRTSDTPAEQIMEDFCTRVIASSKAPASTKQ